MLENNPKIAIIGYARHGKDTVAELLFNQFGLMFMSSSVAASKLFIYDALKEKYLYKTPEECFEDRVNHRAEWFEIIKEYEEKEGLTALSKFIFSFSDIYVGFRNRKAFEASVKEGLVDFTIWVDRSEHLPPERKTSMELNKGDADLVLDNNGSLEELKNKVHRAFKWLA